jgi:hypothetical protein
VLSKISPQYEVKAAAVNTFNANKDLLGIGDFDLAKSSIKEDDKFDLLNAKSAEEVKMKNKFDFIKMKRPEIKEASADKESSQNFNFIKKKKKDTDILTASTDFELQQKMIKSKNSSCKPSDSDFEIDDIFSNNQSLNVNSLFDQSINKGAPIIDINALESLYDENKSINKEKQGKEGNKNIKGLDFISSLSKKKLN